jgi:hypothetical protein
VEIPYVVKWLDPERPDGPGFRTVPGMAMGKVEAESEADAREIAHTEIRRRHMFCWSLSVSAGDVWLEPVEAEAATATGNTGG